MTKEALKLALEALEEAADAIDSWGSYASGYFQVKHDLENDISKAKSAITAIKEALAQPWEKFCDSNCVWTDHHPDCKLAQRTWVGLTDEEILDKCESVPDYDIGNHDLIQFARAIEAKLKEKNT